MSILISKYLKKEFMIMYRENIERAPVYQINYE